MEIGNELTYKNMWEQAFHNHFRPFREMSVNYFIVSDELSRALTSVGKFPDNALGYHQALGWMQTIRKETWRKL